ncbi:hypothetical protein [Nocardia australiensis]|uniref:hypothetical protein n=1 Tax=Nocardia australiensis TaxID=2887191 RepID=UPI001D143BE7|nr:hypothetical protein [Nocardia australiensis]
MPELTEQLLQRLAHDNAHETRSADTLQAMATEILAARARIAELESGAQTLGTIVDRQCRDVLAATGLHHLIDDDGDGDWGLVWERLAGMGAELRAATARIADLESEAQADQRAIEVQS